VLELNGRFARQKFSVKLEHYQELEYVHVHTRFAEFKRRVTNFAPSCGEFPPQLNPNILLPPFPLALVQSCRKGGASCSRRTF
jgi:hypothetical protein